MESSSLVGLGDWIAMTPNYDVFFRQRQRKLSSLNGRAMRGSQELLPLDVVHDAIDLYLGAPEAMPNVPVGKEACKIQATPAVEAYLAKQSQ